MTIYFLKDVLNCKKKHVKNSHVQTLWGPQYENLTLKHISQFCNQYPEVLEYLPDAPDIPKTPKQWIVNVVAAVVGKPFRDWVDAQVEERNALMADKKDVMISLASFSASICFLVRRRLLLIFNMFADTPFDTKMIDM